VPDLSLLTRPRLEGTVDIDAKRRLGIAEFGTPKGRAVFWLHGTPGARRQIPEAARVAAAECNVRLIGVDRPGVGASTPHLYRRVLDFARDMRTVMDSLGIDQAGLIGLSGGGPYTLACAYAMRDRIPAAVVLGGVAPSTGPEAASGSIVALARQFQIPLTLLRNPIAFAISTTVRTLRPVGDPALRLYGWLSPEGDRRVLSRPEAKAMFLDDLFTGSRPGLKAPVFDAILFGRDWGFSVADVRTPVHWWHGDADHIIPLRHGEHMVSLLPNAKLHVFKGESHLFGLADSEAVLDTLLEAWDTGTI
jgi:pimeloyl-ACP methyl ester carboxylesterase